MEYYDRLNHKKRREISRKLEKQGYRDRLINTDNKNFNKTIVGTYIEELPKDLRNELKGWLQDQIYHYEKIESMNSEKLKELVETYDVKILVAIGNKIGIYETIGDCEKTSGTLDIWINDKMLMVLFVGTNIMRLERYKYDCSEELVLNYDSIKFYIKAKREIKKRSYYLYWHKYWRHCNINTTIKISACFAVVILYSLLISEIIGLIYGIIIRLIF